MLSLWCLVCVFRVRRRCCISTLLGQCPIGFCGMRHRVCPCGLPACTTRCMLPQCRAVLLARTLRSRRGSLAAALPATYAQHTEQTFRESFGKDISEYFETFEPKPIASGTVGQVGLSPSACAHRSARTREYTVVG